MQCLSADRRLMCAPMCTPRKPEDRTECVQFKPDEYFVWPMQCLSADRRLRCAPRKPEGSTKCVQFKPDECLVCPAPVVNLLAGYHSCAMVQPWLLKQQTRMEASLSVVIPIQEREGKGREGKGREGKGREGRTMSLMQWCRIWGTSV